MQFRELSLADCAKHIVDNRGRTCPVGDDGLPLIATNCLRGGGLYPTYETTRFVSDETYRTWFRGHPKPGDIIFVTKGSPGRVCLAPNPVDFCVAQDMVAIRADESKVYPKYLFAVLRSQETQQRIENMHVGTLIPHFKKGDFDKLFLPIPDEGIQREIGDLYFELSARIDLLQRTNATLEAIAQALFKSWFVDFDPVRAKAEGRDPEGMPPDVADLFPSGFEDSELGEIPEGWHVGAFSDITDSAGGATPSTKEPAYWEGGHHCWATPKDLSGMDTPVLLDTERKITDAGLNKISSGLLPVGTVLMSSRAPIGYLAIAEVPVAVNQGFIAMKPKAGISNLFLLDLVRARMDEIKSHANGSTFMEISKAAFRPLKVVLPPIPAVQAFDNVARGLYERMVCNVRHIGNLTELRDTLLPRLMSGKLRISSPVTQNA